MEEFSTPLSSPAHLQDARSKESEGSSTSWISWIRDNCGGQLSDIKKGITSFRIVLSKRLTRFVWKTRTL